MCVLVVSSCTRHGELKAVLSRADSLMDIRPDSALALLDSNRPDEDNVPERLLMRYELLRAKAMNKADVLFTSDSVMNEVAAWYEEHGDDRELMEALYLLGCVYRDLGDAPTALKHYKEAVSLADTTKADCDWYTLSRIHGQMATLFNNMGSPEYELEEWRQTMFTSLMAKDTLNALKAYELQVGAYYMMYNEDSVISITQNVRNEYLRRNRKDLAADALHSIMDVYLSQKKYDKAKECLDEFEQYSRNFDTSGNIKAGRESYYGARARYYLGIGKTDSALMYLNKLLLFKSDIMCAEIAYHELMHLYMMQGRADSVIKYAELYCRMNDSSTIVRASEEINRTQALYNYNHAQQIAEEKTEEAGGYLFALKIFALIVCTAGIITYRIYIARKRKALAVHNSEYNDLLQKYNHASDELSKALSGIEEYKRKKEIEMDRLRNSMAEYHEEKESPEEFDKERDLKNSKIALHLHSLAAKGKEATIQELQSVSALVEKKLPDFYGAITDTNIGLTDREVLACMLIRLGFIPSEMATLFRLSLQNITNIKSRINDKMFDEKKAKSLDFKLRRL